ncbi:MAG: GNAT family N-acetyltransferase [Gammaproteobacteria bacterium]|nr:GNAT family N-acetyltransferase [Gammaproteobacteria bacterium]
MSDNVELVHVAASAPDQVSLAKTLFREYAAKLGVDLSFQDFAAELETFPSGYVAPDGALLLAMRGPDAVGCIGVRRFDGAICEMKRLYVRESERRGGLGRRLCEAAFASARELGYERMRLDTLPDMAAARKLYRSLGFQEIAPYYDNPIAGTSYMERQL